MLEHVKSVNRTASVSAIGVAPYFCGDLGSNQGKAATLAMSAAQIVATCGKGVAATVEVRRAPRLWSTAGFVFFGDLENI